MKTPIFFLLSASVVIANNEVQQFIDNSRLFTGAVYNEILVDNNDNFLVSPFSVETVLALTQSGAVGTTATELRASLYLPDSKEETEATIKSVLPTLHSNEFVLKTANKVYVEDNFEIKENFRNVAKSIYEADIQNVEFIQNVNAADRINHWVEEQTNDKIHDLVNANDLDKNTRVVLINALYFQGNWTVPFQPDSTKKAVFYTPENEIQKEMMFAQSQTLNYHDNEELDAKILELPIEGGASLTVVLPNKKKGITLLEKAIPKVLSNFKYTLENVEVSLPKFKIETHIEFDKILKNLGVQAAFDPELADFSDLAGRPGEIFINKVTQKTYIDVNENGVEAAAASSTGTIVGPDLPPPPATKTFKADHPFIFYLKVNDIVLFEGRVLEPTY